MCQKLTETQLKKLEMTVEMNRRNSYGTRAINME